MWKVIYIKKFNFYRTSNELIFCFSGNPKGRMPYAIMLITLVLIFTVALAIIDTYECKKKLII